MNLSCLRSRVLLAGFLTALAGGCRMEAPPAPGAGVLPLFDHWPEVAVDHPTPPAAAAPRAEIRFDGSCDVEVRWSAVSGVERLRVEDGRLVGRTTTAAPVLLLETGAPLGTGDTLWRASLTVAASAGARTGVHPVLPDGPPVEAIVGRAEEWPLTSPLVPGEETKTYGVEVDRVFTIPLPVAETDVTRILVLPTNVAGATFAIEAVRLEFRKEHLASIPSGPGWHGLGEVFRETLVSRAPETLRFRVTLPERPWLDLAVGTISTPAPKFRVAVTGEGVEAETLAELEVEGPERWQAARLDLARWAGQSVELRLSAVADEPGTLAFWGAPTVRNAGAGGDRPQTVIVFLADTLRSDHLDAWGYGRETAPTLSRLAAEGVRFDDVVAQGTWTKVSVSSILTSLYPSTTGVKDLNDRVAAGETTLAEAFRAAGYATFATSSVPFSGQLTNLHQGVEVLYEYGAAQGDGEYRSKTAEFWVTTFLDFLDRHPDVPVFAVIHTMDPHSPFRPAPPFDTLWTGEDDAERFAEQSARVEPHIESPMMRRFMAPTGEELAKAGVDAASFVAQEQAWYDGSIRGLDAQVERLLARVDELGLRERTLLAFVADHGEEFLEHGKHWHGNTVYGEVANVPLVLWGQGVPQGRVVEQTVENLDIMPTLLDLAGVPVPERAQGKSLVPLFAGEGPPRPAFTENRANSPDPGDYDRFAIVDGDWKLVWNDQAPEGVPVHELYDHRADPLNLHELAAEHPDVVARLARDLERWRAHAEAQRLDPEAERADLDSAELERLRSLGYLD